MAMFGGSDIVPVLMYHSIGPRRPHWSFSQLSEPVDCFEGTLAALRRDGYRSVGLQALYDHMAGKRPLEGRCVVLTFDDGYLDNWTIAVPLLRKYEMQATVYVTPDFVEDSDVVRPQADADERPSDAPDGFMSWGELSRAQAEGVLDVQSHALTHTWYYSGPRLVDVHRPRRPDPYPWLAWNERPERKPYYLAEDQQSLVPWGRPVFEHEKSLIVRRFEPAAEAVAAVEGWIAEQGGREFFEREDWRGALFRRFTFLDGTAGVPGRYESEDERRARVLHELRASRRIIEKRLAKPVRFLAWPGGGVDPTAVQLAREAGYLGWTLSSWQEPKKRNRRGTDPSAIKRISGSGSAFWRGRRVAEGDPWWVVHRLRAHRGDPVSRIAIGWRKLTSARGAASATGRGST
jgi:peptidoglycan/xylan/chitin deacetylase (PgdA/CDA1 family)